MDGARILVVCVDGYVCVIDLVDVVVIEDLLVIDGWVYVIVVYLFDNSVVVGGINGWFRWLEFCE